jgi:glycine/D-amino acid oxidase-like deaminating enzyme
VVVVGAGLAGLAAAHAASAAGADVTVLERNDEPGGASRDSAGWIWRYDDLRTARTCAPHADPRVLDAVIRRLDDDLAWLERLGVRRIATGTGRSFTSGVRIDPPQAIEALVGRIDDERLRTRSELRAVRRSPDGAGFVVRIQSQRRPGLPDAPVEELAADAVVFCGGGYAADFARIAAESGAADDARREWVLRARAAGGGSSLDAACGLGALRVPATGESLVRLVPALDELPDPRALTRYGELYLPSTQLLDAAGAPLERAPHDWSGAQAAWTLARTTGLGRLELPPAALRAQVHAGTVEDIVRTAINAGVDAGRLARGGTWLAVRSGITHTACGVRVDPDGRLLQATVGRFGRARAPQPIPGAFAAGCDAAGTGLGGTASGLAQALVLGRSAGTHSATS